MAGIRLLTCAFAAHSPANSETPASTCAPPLHGRGEAGTVCAQRRRGEHLAHPYRRAPERCPDVWYLCRRNDVLMFTTERCPEGCHLGSLRGLWWADRP